MFKLNSGMATELIKELILSSRQHKYELQNNPSFAVQVVKSVHKDLKSLRYLCPKIWKLLFLEVKLTEILLKVKGKIKNCSPQNSPCRICKAYLQNIGFT